MLVDPASQRVQQCPAHPHCHGPNAIRWPSRSIFHQRLQPEHAAGAIAHQSHVSLASRLGFQGAGHRFRHPGPMRWCHGDINTRLMMRARLRQFGQQCIKRPASTLACMSSLPIRNRGEQAQLPRQYTGSRVISPSAVVSPKSMPRCFLACAPARGLPWPGRLRPGRSVAYGGRPGQLRKSW